MLSLLCLALLIGAVTSHKKLKKRPAAPTKFLILQAGPSVTYPWVGHGKVHKALYLPRPFFPPYGEPSVPAYQAVASYAPAPASYASAPPSYAPAAPSYAPDVPQYPSEPQYGSTAPSYAPAAPEYSQAAPEYSPAAPEYTPAVPSYAAAAAAPEYAPAAPEYAPAAPEYAPAIPEYASAAVAPQYDPLPAPIYAEDVAVQPYAIPEGFPSFNDIAPSDVIVEPINSYSDAGFSNFDGPEPRPLEEAPTFGWGAPEESSYAAEESYAQAPVEDVGQEYEAQEPRYAEPAQDVAVDFDEVPVYGEAPGAVDETPAYAEAPETYVEAPVAEEPEYDAAVAESKSFGVRISPRGVNFRA